MLRQNYPMLSTARATSTDSYPILVASSNEFFRRQVISNLHPDSSEVEEAVGGADALNKLESGQCRVLLLDRNLPDLHVDEFMQAVGDRFPGVEVVTLDSESCTAAVGAISERERDHREPCTAAKSFSPAIPGLLGNSDAMRRVFSLIHRVAGKDSTVLLTGETGTGKEVAAEAIHRLSSRAQRPFVTVNCSAIPEALLESELFGYTRGAFTGAVQSRMGRVHTANGGVLFLDEIGDMPLSLQSKLLRFLESGEVQRLGSSDVFRVDVRVIAATNALLALRMAEKQFREDLYYRLAVFPIELPPLRLRGDDVLLLAKHFLQQFCGLAANFDAEAEDWLRAQKWRGNVRELRHAIERASILWDGDGAITCRELQH